jgi:hypothetical protein
MLFIKTLSYAHANTELRCKHLRLAWEPLPPPKAPSFRTEAIA